MLLGGRVGFFFFFFNIGFDSPSVSLGSLGGRSFYFTGFLFYAIFIVRLWAPIALINLFLTIIYFL